MNRETKEKESLGSLMSQFQSLPKESRDRILNESEQRLAAVIRLSSNIVTAKGQRSLTPSILMDAFAILNRSSQSIYVAGEEGEEDDEGLPSLAKDPSASKTDPQGRCKPTRIIQSRHFPNTCSLISSKKSRNVLLRMRKKSNPLWVQEGNSF